MNKYLSVPVTSQGNQLLRSSDVLLVDKTSNTVTTVSYMGGDAVEITHAADTGVVFRDWVQNFILQSVNVGWNVNNPLSTGAAPFAISQIAVATGS